VDLQSIHKTSYFNRLAALPFRKLLIFKGLHPTAFKVLVLGCGTDFRLVALAFIDVEHSLLGQRTQ
jgi:hypothetical protein